MTSCEPGDSGNYSCVPSFTTPDWVMVHVIRGHNQPVDCFRIIKSKFQKIFLLIHNPSKDYLSWQCKHQSIPHDYHDYLLTRLPTGPCWAPWGRWTQRPPQPLQPQVNPSRPIICWGGLTKASEGMKCQLKNIQNVIKIFSAVGMSSSFWSLGSRNFRLRILDLP